MVPMDLMKMPRKRKTVRRESGNTEGIDYILERKSISGMHLYIKPPDGSILVTAPFQVSDEEVEAFVRSKAGWIVKHRKRFTERPAQARMASRYVTGETLFFWGRPYRLIVREEEGRTRTAIYLDPEPVFSVSDQDLENYSSGVCVKPDLPEPEGPGADERTMPEPGGTCTVTLEVPHASTFEQRRDAVKRLYKMLLDREAERVLTFWSHKTGLRYSSWHSRYMKSRWGSLSIRDKRVCLNTRLAEKPEICLIYVALHEIAHVKVPNHGPEFKKVLSDNMPSWRMAEKILKK